MDRLGRPVVLLASAGSGTFSALAAHVDDCGYELIQTSDAADSLRIASEGRVDIAVIDCLGDGEQAAALIAAIRAQLGRALAIAAAADIGNERARRRAREAGADLVVRLPASRIDVELYLAVLRELVELRRECERLSEAVVARAEIDPAIGALSERALSAHLHREFARARRYKLPLSVLVVAVDDLARVTRRDGRQEAERILAAVARVVHGCVREADVLGRVGGDRLAVLAPQTPLAAALVLGNRLCAQVWKRRLGARGGTTVSVGVAALPALTLASAPQLLAAATTASERAAGAGGNLCRGAGGER